jgi:hypothetical protein
MVGQSTKINKMNNDLKSLNIKNTLKRDVGNPDPALRILLDF